MNAPAPLERLASTARGIIDANKYMTLATAGADGAPWASPVFFTPDGYRDLYWVSSPTAKHSRNIFDHAAVAIVVFDSQAPIGEAGAVYMRAEAGEVPADEIEASARRYASRFPELKYFAPEELRAPAPYRLFRARVSEHSVLIRGSDPDFGTGVDSRLKVDL
ncbi:pyridoxamine 5'-phosphate oxidase family protein [Glycomyces harbinensis]|uniref:Pyridoxamine 5'-phosphate oxidase n=1 Tax=Glycomyces harbinensis TaxID=58114 RepID=A0A1G6U7G4_9ACTN|nr:pyridoxamine 5'-phosphate oxidase family protein [Glycomyces harbinensis]SDD37243.1 Pyridoxamine 5'-phosphate oxidase [Glycomyces harbinensis]